MVYLAAAITGLFVVVLLLAAGGVGYAVAHALTGQYEATVTAGARVAYQAELEGSNDAARAVGHQRRDVTD